MKLLKAFFETNFGREISINRRFRIFTFALINLLFNLLYALYNGIIGYVSSSAWFCSMCVYHVILSIMRFSAILCERKKDLKKEYSVMKSTGVLLSVLSIFLTGTLYVILSQSIGFKYGEITMITIATYTFYKITMAVIRAVKYRRENSPVMSSIQNIGYAEIAVSVLTMQMSMLVSFEQGMDRQNIFIFNLLTGIGVCLFTLSLGIFMIKKAKKKD